MHKYLLTVAIAGLLSPALAKDANYIAEINTSTETTADAMARGTVFLDTNRNGTLDSGETGIAGVLVSNGLDVVETGENGQYELPAYSDMNVFVTKPAGYAVPVNDVMVPQFAYIHKEAGSPELRFGGIAPTGALPAEINFPLIEDNSDNPDFECLVFGDAQPYFNMQVSYVRETLGHMLAARDNSGTECLLFQGDVMGDDLTLYPRFMEIVALGDTPQYYVAGNHDFDFDAEEDKDSFDSFRRYWGPEYYSFDIGNVHFVVLDNVRYPCNGVDPHSFCASDARATYNGVITERQLGWLANNLAFVPEDKLIVVNTHIPLQTFTDNTAAKHQTDNLVELVALLEGRQVLAMSGHTHTTENILPGEYFEGWEENTGIGPAPFHQMMTGALSGSWWSGALNDDGVPGAPQRLGSPRGYYHLSFSGSDYVETFHSFSHRDDEQFHTSFNSPRYRDWAGKLMAYVEAYGAERGDILPPVTLNDLGDANMLTRADLEGGTWVAVNVWNGTRDNEVTVSINDGEKLTATRTQAGAGEAKLRSIEASDPYAIIRQFNDTSRARQSATGNDGYEMFQGSIWTGHVGPLDAWMWTNASSHLWTVDLPADLPAGVHRLNVTTTDRHGRSYTDSIAFEVVEEIPDMGWQERFWE